METSSKLHYTCLGFDDSKPSGKCLFCDFSYSDYVNHNLVARTRDPLCRNHKALGKRLEEWHGIAADATFSTTVGSSTLGWRAIFKLLKMADVLNFLD